MTAMPTVQPTRAVDCLRQASADGVAQPRRARRRARAVRQHTGAEVAAARRASAAAVSAAASSG